MPVPPAFPPLCPARDGAGTGNKTKKRL
jgi:hypothetical protein